MKTFLTVTIVTGGIKWVKEKKEHVLFEHVGVIY